MASPSDNLYERYARELDTLIEDVYKASTNQEATDRINAVVNHCRKLLNEKESTATDFLSLQATAHSKLIKVLAFRIVELNDELKKVRGI